MEVIEVGYGMRSKSLFPFSLLGLVVFLIPNFSPCQDDDGGPQPDPKIVNQIKLTWVNEQNAKLLPEAYKNIPDKLEQLNDQEEHCYVPWSEKYPVEQGAKLGIPSRKDICQLEGMKKPYVVLLGKMNGTVLDGQRLLLAEYQKNGFRYSILYILRSSGPQTLLYGGGGCSEIHLFKPGSKAQIFIMLRSSACGSGYGEHLYKFQKDGSLKKVADLGGWHAGISYVDIGGHGWLEIIDSFDELSTPKDLMARLKMIKNYNTHRGGAEVQHNKILKWNGEEFATVGEFYLFSPF